MTLVVFASLSRRFLHASCSLLFWPVGLREQSTAPLCRKPNSDSRHMKPFEPLVTLVFILCFLQTKHAGNASWKQLHCYLRLRADSTQMPTANSSNSRKQRRRVFSHGGSVEVEHNFGAQSGSCEKTKHNATVACHGMPWYAMVCHVPNETFLKMYKPQVHKTSQNSWFLIALMSVPSTGCFFSTSPPAVCSARGL